MKNKNGFTLLELLVVVLIIGILASIALPQYEKAVNKARVASILPVMRRWKDALADYKLQHGSYCKKGTDDDCDEWPDGSDLDVICDLFTISCDHLGIIVNSTKAKIT